MLRRAIVPLIVVALAACSGGDEAAETSEPTAASIETGIPPEPDQATADAYIAALDAINPGIDRDDPDSAIDRGRNVCSAIYAHPQDRAYQVETTNERFTSPGHPEGWGTAIAERVLDATHQHLCPSY